MEPKGSLRCSQKSENCNALNYVGFLKYRFKIIFSYNLSLYIVLELIDFILV
jgi:hypothetical protein